MPSRGKPVSASTGAEPGAREGTAPGWTVAAREATRELLDFLLPARCLGCRVRIPPDARDGRVCPACLARFRPPTSPRCPRCHLGMGTGRSSEPDCLACRWWPPALVGARWAVSLASPAAELVHGLKYGGWRGLAGTLAARMAELPLPEGFGPERALAVPVPTTRRRERRRGYNQALLLATEYTRRTGHDLHQPLVRAGTGTTQVALDPEGRRANVEGAFRIGSGRSVRLEGRSVVLVDDVLTTGATASAAAATLERAGASGVVVVTFARSLPGRDEAPSRDVGQGPDHEPRGPAG